MQKLRVFAATAAILAAALLGLPSNPALAEHVKCGDVITRDTTLDSDLIQCPGDGVVIGSANVTLDLNGHLIDSDRNPYRCSSGVLNGRLNYSPWCGEARGYDGVTVEDGVVRDFNFGGVHLDHVNRNTVRGVSLPASSFLGGVPAWNTILLGNSNDNYIANNTITGGIGSILLESDSDRNQIAHNRVTGTLVSGIGLLLGSDRNRITDNELSHTSSGIAVGQTTGNRIAKNTVSFADSSGISIIGADNRIEENNVYGTTGAEPGGVGIWVTNAAGSLIKSNLTTNNEDDGIRVLSGGVVLKGNAANENGDLGIQAVEGVRDGGHNTAFGNGNPLQCLNVVCR